MIIVPELIKTLEGLLNQGDSPIGSEFGVIIDKQTIKTAIDLINSQQKEVERLISILLKLLDGITTWGIINHIDTTNFSLIPILEDEKNNIVRQIRYNAVDEFSDKLTKIYINDKRYDRPMAHTLIGKLFDNIDSVAAEMKGE